MADEPILPVDELVRLLAEFGDATLESVEEKGMAELMDLLESKAVELAPVDTGNLESSTVVRVNREGNRIVGELAFTAPYATEVHELPEHARGPKTQQKPGNEFGPAGPKFLERPLSGFQRELSKGMADFLREQLKRTAARGRRRR